MTTIEHCYCPYCEGGNAVTMMLPTRIPLFREIIVMNLTCEDCGFRNAEVNFGGEIQEKGERLALTVRNADDLNRQVIKSDSATIIIPALDFEIPPSTQRGTISTLEGILRRAASNLEEQQPERLRLQDVDNFHRCRKVIRRLRQMAGDTDVDYEDGSDEENAPVFPFTFILDDPAGNSFIENLFAPQPDPNLHSEKYWRTATQDMQLGLQPSEKAREAGMIDDQNPDHKNVVNAAKGHHKIGFLSSRGENVGREEAMKFTTTCSHCYRPAETSMCVTDIPHFKEVIIMSLLCENCGYKSNEIKGGGAIPQYGTKITLSVRGPDDLEREVLKSDTAGVAIPEIDLALEEGGLDGLYTTIEGLLNKIHERLKSANPFGTGDSAMKQHRTNDGGEFTGLSPTQARFLAFLQKMKDMADGRTFPFTIIISDPLSNSFIGPMPRDAMALSLQAERDGNNRCYEEFEDAGMYVEEYERSFEQNEVLGLNDMKTENYQQAGENPYYGTDAPEELPDRIRRSDVRGPDHPHQVGKAPVEGDNTIMGVGSANFAVPSMTKRGQHAHAPRIPVDSSNSKVIENRDIRKLIHDAEFNDSAFIMNDEYSGPREGMVFKDGAQGLGYYQDVLLTELWAKEH